MSEHKHTPADRVQRYLAMRKAMPAPQMGDGIHFVHAGAEGEGELLLSDLASVMASQSAMLEALYRAQEALGEYACHIGDKHPCMRTREQCRESCGRIAGDAALIVDAAIALTAGGQK